MMATRSRSRARRQPLGASRGRVRATHRQRCHCPQHALEAERCDELAEITAASVSNRLTTAARERRRHGVGRAERYIIAARRVASTPASLPARPRRVCCPVCGDAWQAESRTVCALLTAC